ncbi:MAG: ATP-binding protein [Limisphaerales bacterium]
MSVSPLIPQVTADSNRDTPHVPMAPLEAVVCTEELKQRPRRAPSYEIENRALTLLAQALADSPQSVLQTLADTILTVLHSGSAGISLLTKDEKRFYWPAIAGAWKPNIGSGTFRDFGPCGDVLNCNGPLLMRHPERRYGYFPEVMPPGAACLLVPFYVKGKAVGTIWAVTHDEERQFDAEDLRLLASLGRFASSAYQVVAFMEAFAQQNETMHHNHGELEKSLADLRHANLESKQARSASLNLMEDAVRARQSLEAVNAELFRSKESYRSLFNSIDEGFCVIEMLFDEKCYPVDYRFMESNPSFEKQSGLREATGKRMREMVPNHEAHWFEIFGKVALTGEPVRFINEAKGLNRWFDVYAFRVSDHENRKVAVLFSDISARVATDASLRQAQLQLADRAVHLEQAVTERTAELTASNKDLEAFVYSIAHDLRAPLRAMQGFSELLLHETKATLSAQAKDYTVRINKSAGQMDALLRDLLAFSRIAQQEMKFHPINLKTVVASVISLFHDEIRDKQAVVESIGPWCEVQGHEAALGQVFVNLISNALKFVRPGMTPTIRLCTTDAGEFVRVWVEDNGLGISLEYHPQIFKIFTRLNGNDFPGTGIGLAIVEKAIQRMGGRVGVEPKTGGGSSFWFELRKAPAAKNYPA